MDVPQTCQWMERQYECLCTGKPPLTSAGQESPTARHPLYFCIEGRSVTSRQLLCAGSLCILGSDESEVTSDTHCRYQTATEPMLLAGPSSSAFRASSGCLGLSLNIWSPLTFKLLGVIFQTDEITLVSVFEV